MKRLLLILFFLLVPAKLVAQEHGQQPAHAQAAAEEAGHDAAQPVDNTATGHGAEHQEKVYFGFIPAWVLKLVNMLLFFGILIYLLKKPLGTAFSERRAQINGALSEAATRKQKASQLASDIQSRLSQIEGEVASIMDRAREEGERQKREMVAAAEEEAKKILAAAQIEIDTKMKAARNELTAYARELATQRAQQLVEANLNDADRKRLFAESVKEVAGASS
jgi:F-type H+-transporting ATPase subunit b